MAKTKISQFDATASNNTDINSVNVAEGCPPSGINNAIREMASLLKKQEVGTDAMTSPDIDGGTIDGATIGGSSGVTIGVSDGTVSAPSIKFTGDTNTGIYRGGTDILKFVTAGTDAITINASQDVTFAGNITGGLTSTGDLDVSSTNPRIRMFETDTTNLNTQFQTNGGNFLIKTLLDDASNSTSRITINHSTGDISFYEDTGTTPKFFWDSSAESLGIGNSSPNAKTEITTSAGENLRLTKATGAYLSFHDGTVSRGAISGISGADGLQFTSGASGIDMTLDGSGNLLVGGTVSSGSNAPHNTNSATYEGFVLGESGSLLVGSALQPVGQLNAIGYDGDILRFRKDGSTVGAIGTNGGKLTLLSIDKLIVGDGDTGLIFRGDINAIFPWDSTTDSIRDNAIDLGRTVGRFKDLYLSGGVYLGGTGSANKLDDYEEGTYTPIVASTTTNPTVTYLIQEGNYTKVGRQVTVTGEIRFSAFTSNGGSLRLEGLPFSVFGDTNYRAVGSVSVSFAASNLTGDYTNLQLSFNSGTSGQIIMNNSVTGGAAETPVANIDSGTIIRYQITYIVA